MTPLDEGIETLRAQVQWLANALAASMSLMFAAIALPWLARMIDVELARTAWTLTAFAAVYAALTLALPRVASRAAVLRLLFAVPLFGVAAMALLWHYGGGLAHPALALAMVLPVIAAAALPRAGFALDVALYSILVVVITAAATSPDLAWYATQLGIPASALAFGEDLARVEPFPGATTTPAAMFLTVATFAAVQLAAAAFATRLAKFVRTREDVALLVHESEVDTLPAAAMRTTPAAAVVVVAATGQIVQATKHFTQQMLLHNEAIVGRELLDLLGFDDAAAIRALLANGGELASCRYDVGPEARIADVRAETFVHGGVTYASVVVHDLEVGLLAAEEAQ